MLFKQIQLKGIKSGEISLAFRKWKSTRIKSGSLINTSIGRIEILKISETTFAKITKQNCKKAGYENKQDLQKIISKIKEGSIYEIQLKYHSPDPRIKLRTNNKASEAELSALNLKLHKLDKLSKQGDWTQMLLQLIKENPETRAADLALMIDREKTWLKLNVRKLKNLGLTISHGVGYTISPLGNQFMKYQGMS